MPRKNPADVDFPKISRAWRERMGLSREEAADMLGVPPRSLEGWELGRVPRYPQPVILAMHHLQRVYGRRATRRRRRTIDGE